MDNFFKVRGLSRSYLTEHLLDERQDLVCRLVKQGIEFTLCKILRSFNLHCLEGTLGQRCYGNQQHGYFQKAENGTEEPVHSTQDRKPEDLLQAFANQMADEDDGKHENYVDNHLDNGLILAFAQPSAYDAG